MRLDNVGASDDRLAVIFTFSQELAMSWHVRFFSSSLNQDVLSVGLPTEKAAFEEAWRLAESGESITLIEGPDGDVASAEEVELWFRAQGRTQSVANPN